jgi:dihydrolipoamide dehydrogenase
MDKFDIAVIGGGAAGLVAASGSVQLGARTALIEKDRLGGDCLWYGCVPSKALIKSAKVVHLLKRVKDYGVDDVDIRFDFKNVIGKVQSLRSRIGEHDDPARFEKMGVKLFTGAPKFVSNEEIEINGERLKSKKIVIATGSSPFVPPIEGLKDTGYITNVEVFSLKKLPGSLAVIGGGPIGIELAQALSRLGSDVTVIEMLDRILIKEDKEVSSELTGILEAEGMKIMTGTKVVKVRKEGDKKIVTVLRDGKEEEVVSEEILMSVGRIPNVDGLDLEKAGVEYDRRGIKVDKSLKTTASHIWACGDVAGPYQFTHMAEYQAGIVIRNALFHIPAHVDYSAVPWATYTDPEVATVGIIEEMAAQQGIKHKVFKFEFSGLDRAIIEQETKGFVKIVCTPSGKLLGATIIGHNAGELIHEYVLAVKEGMPLSKISSTIHIYPTVSQIIKRTCDKYYSEKLFSGNLKKITEKLIHFLP